MCLFVMPEIECTQFFVPFLLWVVDVCHRVERVQVLRSEHPAVDAGDVLVCQLQVRGEVTLCFFQVADEQAGNGSFQAVALEHLS